MRRPSTIVLTQLGGRVEITRLRSPASLLHGQEFLDEAVDLLAVRHPIHVAGTGKLALQIAAIVKESRWTQTEAASHCGVTQPRMNGLLRGRVSRFSLDALVNIATAIGRRVHIELEAAYSQSRTRGMNQV